jgi:hypothetical protein
VGIAGAATATKINDNSLKACLGEDLSGSIIVEHLFNDMGKSGRLAALYLRTRRSNIVRRAAGTESQPRMQQMNHGLKVMNDG